MMMPEQLTQLYNDYTREANKLHNMKCEIDMLAGSLGLEIEWTDTPYGPVASGINELRSE